MSNPNPPAPARRSSRRLVWFGAVALALYAWFLTRHGTVVAGGADSSGYFNSAKLFTEGSLFTPLRVPPEFRAAGRVDPLHFLPLGFVPAANPAMLAPTYPTGLPLHLAPATVFLGWDFGARVVFVGAALAALWLTYLSARRLGLGPALAGSGAVMLGAFPVFLFTSVQPLSDTLATTWALAAMYCTLRATEGPKAWAAAAGAAFAFAVLVRPSNLLLAPALLVLTGFDWRRWFWFGLGGVPGAAWQAFYNHHLYGHALRSGYGNIFESFGTQFGGPTTLHFAKWLAQLLPAIVLVLPLAALTRPGFVRRELLGLALAFGAITGCYLFYEVSHEVWWCLRFILPGVPALILGALLGVEALARGPGQRWPVAFRPVAAAALAVWAVGLSWYWSPRLSVFMMRHYEQAYADGVAAAKRQLPANAAVLCEAFSGTLYFDTGFSVMRWDQINADAFSRYVLLAAKAGRPVYALLFDSEKDEAFRRCAGEWTRIETVRNVGLWQLAPRP